MNFARYTRIYYSYMPSSLVYKPLVDTYVICADCAHLWYEVFSWYFNISCGQREVAEKSTTVFKKKRPEKLNKEERLK